MGKKHKNRNKSKINIQAVMAQSPKVLTPTPAASLASTSPVTATEIFTIDRAIVKKDIRKIILVTIGILIALVILKTIAIKTPLLNNFGSTLFRILHIG